MEYLKLQKKHQKKVKSGGRDLRLILKEIVVKPRE